MSKKFSAEDHHFLGDWGVTTLNTLCDTKRALAAALVVAFNEHRTASHYSVIDNETTGGNALTLFWVQRDGDNAIPLPFSINAEKALAFVTNWLEGAGRWPTNRPDTDGSTLLGFRVVTGEDFYVCATITPTWVIYGK